VRPVTAVALLRPTARAMTWIPLLVAAAIGTAIVAVPVVTGLDLTPNDVANLLRFAAVFAGLGAAFLLDDPAATTTSVVPTPRRLRHAVRFVVAVPVLAVWWGFLWWTTVAGVQPGTAPGWLLRGLTVEAAAVAAVAFALASAALRRLPDGAAGVIAAPALLAAVVSATALPAPVELLVPPGGGPGAGRWNTAHRWWWAVIAVAVIVVIWTSRDLTSRRIRPRHLTTSGGSARCRSGARR
jgi:hypothetical protein